MRQRNGIRMLETIRALPPVRTSRSQDAKYKFSGLGAPTTARPASASVSTTSVATVDTLSGSPAAPWPAHRPLTTLLLGLNENPDAPSSFSVDPDATVATLRR